MMTIPGKKLLFMGTEYSQFREWDYENQLEWFMLDFPAHKKMMDFISDLNNLYLKERSLWEIDGGWEGFSWIEADNRDENTVSYVRRAIDGDFLIVSVNFSATEHTGHALPVPEAGKYRIVLSSDNALYGGSGPETPILETPDGSKVLSVTLPPLSGLIIKKYKENKPFQISEGRNDV